LDAQNYKSQLFTRFDIPEKKYIGLNSKIFFTGSCFAENMGSKLQLLGFETLINPFGIIYNPASIFRSIERIQSGIPYSENDLYFYQGKYHSLDHHGSYNSTTARYLLDLINQRLTDAAEFIRQCDVVVLTPGTSFVYVHEPSGKTVANCHKLPNNTFIKEILNERSILELLQMTVLKIRTLNPKAHIVFTLSPVKHLRDGVAENALSKARLLSAIQQFISVQTEWVADYFPAYEIMTEELRDHRFYESDLAHPGNWSLEYIFRRFVESRFEDRSIEFINKFEKYIKMRDHKPMTSDNAELTIWANQKKKYLESLILEFPEKKFNSQEG
jgi:hypothetical protein